jgi:glutathione S-transferase
MDFPNLPYLVDGNFKVSETFAVHVYIAQMFCPSIYGTTPQEQARVTQLNRIGDENFMNFIKMCFHSIFSGTIGFTLYFCMPLADWAVVFEPIEEF